MWHRLALKLGGTVDELQERMSSMEFTYWLSFYNAEPWGYEIGNFRAGVVASSVVNVAPRKKGAKPLKPSDFYPAKPVKVVLSERQKKVLLDRKNRLKRNQ